MTESRDERRRRDLELFARGADMRVPSGHAAGQVLAVLPDAGCVAITFGADIAWFRIESFPTVRVGDFVVVGPAVSRWHVQPKGES